MIHKGKGGEDELDGCLTDLSLLSCVTLERV
jgi:hypothetical protein